MDLRLDLSVGVGYRSRSQWARRVTEAWATRELYCWSCPASKLVPHIANMKVEDFHCVKCGRRSQLKAKGTTIGSVIVNSAYDAKVKAIRANRAPDYLFLSYSRDQGVVQAAFVVPGHFLTETIISKRRPLRATAKRAGWVGSNIHLGRLPQLAKVHLVADGTALPTRAVRRNFSKVRFVALFGANRRGWLTDVLKCLENLNLKAGDSFRLRDMYSFEGRLAHLHPANKHIRPKIRQQLQVLRDHGVIRFMGKGLYVKV